MKLVLEAQFTKRLMHNTVKLHFKRAEVESEMKKVSKNGSARIRCKIVSCVAVHFYHFPKIGKLEIGDEPSVILVIGMQVVSDTPVIEEIGSLKRLGVWFEVVALRVNLVLWWLLCSYFINMPI